MIFSEETHRAADKFAREVGALPPLMALGGAVVALAAFILGIIVVSVNALIIYADGAVIQFVAAVGTMLLWVLIVVAGIWGFTIFVCFAYVDSLKPDVPFVQEKV